MIDIVDPGTDLKLSIAGTAQVICAALGLPV